MHLELVAIGGEKRVLSDRQFQHSCLLTKIVRLCRIDGPINIYVEIETLDKIIEYLDIVKDKKPLQKNYDSYDISFGKEEDAYIEGIADDLVLFSIANFANYLDIQMLVELACKRIAIMLKKTSLSELRKQITDYDGQHTVDEEEIQKKYSWIFDYEE